jgi:hypothetical protein
VEVEISADRRAVLRGRSRVSAACSAIVRSGGGVASDSHRRVRREAKSCRPQRNQPIPRLRDRWRRVDAARQGVGLIEGGQASHVGGDVPRCF